MRPWIGSHAIRNLHRSRHSNRRAHSVVGPPKRSARYAPGCLHAVLCLTSSNFPRSQGTRMRGCSGEISLMPYMRTGA